MFCFLGIELSKTIFIYLFVIYLHIKIISLFLYVMEITVNPLEKLRQQPQPHKYEPMDFQIPIEDDDDDDDNSSVVKEEDDDDAADKPQKKRAAAPTAQRRKAVPAAAVLDYRDKLPQNKLEKLLALYNKQLEEEGEKIVAPPLELVPVELPPPPPDDAVVAAPAPTVKPRRGRPPRKNAVRGDDVAPPPRRNAHKFTYADKDVLLARLQPRAAPIHMRVPSYYMVNRKKFAEQVQQYMQFYETEINNVDNEQFSCETSSIGEVSDIQLLTHQKIVRDYLNLHTPYRGLLLYHGLGSGKTCSSIAIAEGMKSQKHVFIMTPASLRQNFLNELRKCGDELYKKTHYWEFISTTDTKLARELSQELGLPEAEIKKHGGVWLVNMKKKETNYNDLDIRSQTEIDEQIKLAIESKYTIINYNGLNRARLNELTGNGKKNPFNNSVVIIEEAHNLVSRIINKLGVKKKPEPISQILYENLMAAENARVVLLTGTPIINHPREISVLFNILRGYIKSWTFTVSLVEGGGKLTKKRILQILQQEGFHNYDYIELSGDKLTITRNPFSFVNVPISDEMRENDPEENYQGVMHNDDPTQGNNITDAEFKKRIVEILANHHIKSTLPRQATLYKALNEDTFSETFINENSNVQNVDILKRRILGLTSYFRSAQEQLLPRYNKYENFHRVFCPMSDYQFQKYEEIRHEERKQEKQKRKRGRGAAAAAAAAKKADDDNTNSTYRVFSRAACNFVFPDEIPRPRPKVSISVKGDTATAGEDDLDGLDVNEQLQNIEGQVTVDDVAAINQEDENKIMSYKEEIESTLQKLKTNADNYLSTEGNLEKYSPKFAAILENLQNPDHQGLHLVYSQFRTLEGIAVLKLILETNGFVELRLKRAAPAAAATAGANEWIIPVETVNAITVEGKRCFALYTGTEDAEYKELIRNIYNSDWHAVPAQLAEQLRSITANNHYGELVKILMITASGSEGINLRNTRYVHITEPYWHPARIEQIIGRARRICSHRDLPEELRTVEVFLYLAQLTEKQKSEGEQVKELRLHDARRAPRGAATAAAAAAAVKDDDIITTDEYLQDTLERKENISQQILTIIKETAIDCFLYKNKLEEQGEHLVCYHSGHVTTNDFLSHPNLERDKQVDYTQKQRVIDAVVITVPINGRQQNFVLDKTTGLIYDVDEYKRTVTTGIFNIQAVGQVEGDANTLKLF